MVCHTFVLTSIYTRFAHIVSRCKYYDVSRCIILYDDVRYVCTSRRDDVYTRRDNMILYDDVCLDEIICVHSRRDYSIMI